MSELTIACERWTIFKRLFLTIAHEKEIKFLPLLVIITRGR